MKHSTVDALYEQVRASLPADPEQDAEPPQMHVVAPGIRALALRTPTLPPARHTNVYLVGPERGPVAVVDPGSPYPLEQAALDAVLVHQPPAVILLTHHHADHTGGAQALADRWNVPIAAHRTTAALLEDRVRVTQFIEDGEHVHGVVALHTPGHAPGHLCFETADAWIAGDMVAGVGTILIDPGEGDMAQYLASLERLLARPARGLLPAHGPPIADGPKKLREYLAHRQMREAKILGALVAAKRPMTTEDLVAAVYADTPRPMWPLATRSLLAHMVKLEVERKAVAIPGRGWASGSDCGL